MTDDEGLVPPHLRDEIMKTTFREMHQVAGAEDALSHCRDMSRDFRIARDHRHAAIAKVLHHKNRRFST
jgi:hypothetical protein